MFTSRSAAETQALAERFAPELKRGDVVGICGELGAGKTQFVKGLARGLGSADIVTSPTFTILHEYYGGRLSLYHFDLYRLENVNALRDIGFDTYLSGNGVCVIEWADKFPQILPPSVRWIDFNVQRRDLRMIEVSEAR